MQVGLVEVGIGLHKRFSVERQKEIGRSVAQCVAKKTGRGDSHHGKWLRIDIEDAADDGGIRSIPLLPQPIAHYYDGGSARSIVGRRKHTSGIRIYTEHDEVVAGDELAWIASGRFSTARASYAKQRRARLDRCQFGQAFGVAPDVLVQN